MRVVGFLFMKASSKEVEVHFLAVYFDEGIGGGHSVASQPQFYSSLDSGRRIRILGKKDKAIFPKMIR